MKLNKNKDYSCKTELDTERLKQGSTLSVFYLQDNIDRYELWRQTVIIDCLLFGMDFQGQLGSPSGTLTRHATGAAFISTISLSDAVITNQRLINNTALTVSGICLAILMRVSDGRDE